MTDELNEHPVEPAAEEAQPEAQEWASIEVDVPGMNKRMTLDNVVKGSHEAQRTMHEALRNEQAAVQARDDQARYFNPIQDHYNANPEFKAYVDANVFGQQAPVAAPTGAYPQQGIMPDRGTQQLQADVALMKNNASFDALRAKGLSLTPEMETKVLQECARTGNFDVEANAWKLHGETWANEKAENAAASSAQEVVDSQSVYKRPPAGGRAPARKDGGYAGLNDDEAYQKALQDITDSGLGQGY